MIYAPDFPIPQDWVEQIAAHGIVSVSTARGQQEVHGCALLGVQLDHAGLKAAPRQAVLGAALARMSVPFTAASPWLCSQAGTARGSGRCDPHDLQCDGSPDCRELTSLPGNLTIFAEKTSP
jgi:hypothetical protein